MHHLLVTRKAADTIASAWRYFRAKREKSKNLVPNPNYVENKYDRKMTYTAIDPDLRKHKIKMDSNIQGFKHERI